MSFTVCTEPSKEIFELQCESLEETIPNIKLQTKLQDVDGSETAVYLVGGKKIEVHNSYYIGAVYIDSEVDLDRYF